MCFTQCFPLPLNTIYFGGPHTDFPSYSLTQLIMVFAIFKKKKRGERFIFSFAEAAYIYTEREHR